MWCRLIRVRVCLPCAAKVLAQFLEHRVDAIAKLLAQFLKHGNADAAAKLLVQFLERGADAAIKYRCARRRAARVWNDTSAAGRPRRANKLPQMKTGGMKP
jgi:hypothetical protein